MASVDNFGSFFVVNLGD